MAAVTHLDTHVVLWLYAGLVEEVSGPAQRTIEECPCVVSPMVVLEMRFLHEIGRLHDEPQTVLASLASTIGMQVMDTHLGQLVDVAQDLHWTRDPFDRLITAQARVARASLVTRDRQIRAHYERAVW